MKSIRDLEHSESLHNFVTTMDHFGLIVYSEQHNQEDNTIEFEIRNPEKLEFVFDNMVNQFYSKEPNKAIKASWDNERDYNIIRLSLI